MPYDVAFECGLKAVWRESTAGERKSKGPSAAGTVCKEKSPS